MAVTRIAVKGLARLAGLGLLSGFAVGAAADMVSAPAKMTILQKWTLGGEGGWDYLTLDSSARRLFVSRATRVDVVATDSGKIVGSIPGTNGVHGIALAEDLKRGYTSNGKGDSITVFDLDSLKVIQEVKIPAHNPDAILYEPVGKHIFTFNGKSKDVTVLDAVKLTVIATLPVPDKPEFAVDDGAGRIYVNIESEPGQMAVIDSRTLKMIATWPLPGCASPSGLAIDKAAHRLFSVCDDKVMAITDASTGKQIARATVGDGPDAAAFDAARKLVFSSNGQGTLTVLKQDSADSYRVAETVSTQRGARTMALDPASGKVYLVTADFGPAPPATAEQPHPRPVPVAGTFTLLVVGTH
jgi:YVTN family beta-propeller protein